VQSVTPTEHLLKDRLFEAMNDSAYWIAAMPYTLRKVYLLLRIGLPDALCRGRSPPNARLSPL